MQGDLGRIDAGRAARHRQRHRRRQEVLRRSHGDGRRGVAEAVAVEDLQRIDPFDGQGELGRVGPAEPVSARRTPEHPVDGGEVVDHVAGQVEQAALRIDAGDGDAADCRRRPVADDRIEVEPVLFMVRRMAVFEADAVEPLGGPDDGRFGERAGERLPGLRVAHAVGRQPHLAGLAVVERELEVGVADAGGRVGDHLPDAGRIGVAVPAVSAVERVAGVEAVVVRGIHRVGVEQHVVAARRQRDPGPVHVGEAVGVLRDLDVRCRSGPRGEGGAAGGIAIGQRRDELDGKRRGLADALGAGELRAGDEGRGRQDELLPQIAGLRSRAEVELVDVGRHAADQIARGREQADGEGHAVRVPVVEAVGELDEAGHVDADGILGRGGETCRIGHPGMDDRGVAGLDEPLDERPFPHRGGRALAPDGVAPVHAVVGQLEIPRRGLRGHESDAHRRGVLLPRGRARGDGDRERGGRPVDGEGLPRAGGVVAGGVAHLDLQLVGALAQGCEIPARLHPVQLAGRRHVVQPSGAGHDRAAGRARVGAVDGRQAGAAVVDPAEGVAQHARAGVGVEGEQLDGRRRDVGREEDARAVEHLVGVEVVVPAQPAAALGGLFDGHLDLDALGGVGGMVEDEHERAARRKSREAEEAAIVGDRAVEALVAELHARADQADVGAVGFADDAGEGLVLHEVHAAARAQVVRVAALVLEVEAHRPVVGLVLPLGRVRQILDRHGAGGHVVEAVDPLLAFRGRGDRGLRAVGVRQAHGDAVDARVGIVRVGRAAAEDGAALRLDVHGEGAHVVERVRIAQAVDRGAAAVEALPLLIARCEVDRVRPGVGEERVGVERRRLVDAQLQMRGEAAVVQPLDLVRIPVDAVARDPARVRLGGALAVVAEEQADRRPLVHVGAAFAPAVLGIDRDVMEDDVRHVRAVVDGKGERDPRRIRLQPDAVDGPLIRPVVQPCVGGRRVAARQHAAQARHDRGRIRQGERLDDRERVPDRLVERGVVDRVGWIEEVLEAVVGDGHVDDGRLGVRFAVGLERHERVAHEHLQVVAFDDHFAAQRDGADPQVRVVGHLQQPLDYLDGLARAREQLVDGNAEELDVVHAAQQRVAQRQGAVALDGEAEVLGEAQRDLVHPVVAELDAQFEAIVRIELGDVRVVRRFQPHPALESVAGVDLRGIECVDEVRGGREPVGNGVGQQIPSELRPVGHERLPARVLVHVAIAAFERKAHGDALLDLRRAGQPGQPQTQSDAQRQRCMLLHGPSFRRGGDSAFHPPAPFPVFHPRVGSHTLESRAEVAPTSYCVLIIYSAPEGGK